MEKAIPILPCANINEQVDFYQALGFALVKLYKSPNAYAVLRYGEVELNFYGNKKFVPAENPNVCILLVDDVDKTCEAFSRGLKNAYGKIPRTGIPKITKVRDLNEDRRFTLTDTGGNTLYVCTPNEEGAGALLRDLENKEHAKNFAVLYDLLYSKEDKKLAAGMLEKMTGIRDALNDADKARFLLLERAIRGRATAESENMLQDLLKKHGAAGGFWEKAAKKYDQLLQDQ